MKDSSKKVIISSLLILILGIALLAIIKMPTKTKEFVSERTFVFTNESSASRPSKKTTAAATNVNSNTIVTKGTEKSTVSNNAPGIASLSQRPINEKSVTRKSFDFMFKQFIGKLKEINPSSVERKEVEEFVTEQIDFKVESTYSSDIPSGEERVSTEGQYGEKVTLYKIVYENGVEVSRTVISSQITKEPVNKVVVIGSGTATEPTPDTTPTPTPEPTPDTTQAPEPTPDTTQAPDPAPDTTPQPAPDTTQAP